MEKSLYDALLDYKNLDFSSFHTPGHKNNFFKNHDLISLDFTELPQTDSLYEASSIIKNSEKKLSKLYESEESFFSSGGNTLCIQAMIKMGTNNTKKIFCDRLVHRSLVSTLALLNLEPIWIKRNIRNGIAWDIDIQDLKEKIEKNKQVKAFYITSPNYYGVMQDISTISKLCKKNGIALLVDNAHGAHLKFLGLHPIDKGASISADSAHKTLPVLTAGAFLHVNDRKFISQAKQSMALFGSTSPSYIIMSSMDIAIDWLFEKGKHEYEKLAKKVSNFKKIFPFKDLFLDSDDIDPIRITINAKSIGYTGYEIRKYFYKFKIQPEMVDENFVVLIVTPFNTQRDCMRLILAIKNLEPRKARKLESKNLKMRIPERVISISEALSSNSKEIPIKDSIGKVAAEIVCPCPPGIPIVMPGEKIQNQEYISLLKYGISYIHVVK